MVNPTTRELLFAETPPRRRVPGLRHLEGALPSLPREAHRFGRHLRALADALPSSAFYLTDRWSRAFVHDIAALRLVGPKSPLYSRRLKAGVFLMGPGVYYPAHAHAAAELYLPVSGGLRFSRGGSGGPGEFRKPGEPVYHRPHQPHAMESGGWSVLLLYLWMGDLTRPSWYKGDPEDPEEPPKYPAM